MVEAYWLVSLKTQNLAHEFLYLLTLMHEKRNQSWSMYKWNSYSLRNILTFFHWQSVEAAFQVYRFWFLSKAYENLNFCFPDNTAPEQTTSTVWILLAETFFWGFFSQQKDKRGGNIQKFTNFCRISIIHLRFKT